MRKTRSVLALAHQQKNVDVRRAISGEFPLQSGLQFDIALSPLRSCQSVPLTNFALHANL